ncbi:MAG: class B sortase [Oscillospiraceae bacterium]|nr:class B sortase [Oscillospiraceae bacterium]
MSDEEIQRAEKIKTIKKSIDINNNTQTDCPKNSKDWELEMSRSIAEKVQKLKSKDEELLAVLNSTKKSGSTDKIKSNEEINNLINSIFDVKKPENSQTLKYTENKENTEDTETQEKSVVSEEDNSDIPTVQEYIAGDSDDSYDSGETELKKEMSIPKVTAPNLDNNKHSRKRKKRKSFKERFLGLFPQKGDSAIEKCRKIVYMISIITIVVCGSIVLDYYIDTTTTQNKYEDIMKIYDEPVAVLPTEPVQNKEEVKIDYHMMPNAETLYNMNNDVVGVINIPDTDVFYPVVKGRDNFEYLNKTVTGEEARAGSIFIDYRNIFDEVKNGVMQKNSDNIVIYGHEMATGKMFGSLKMYKENSYYYEQHPIIEFNSNYFCYKYKIFSIMIIDAEDKTDTRYEYWNALDFKDEKEFYDFVNEAKRRTIRLNDVDVKYGDPIITLSTCNEIFGKEREGRLVVMARRVRDGEDLLAGTQNSSSNQNVKWPSLYYEYNNTPRFREEEFVPYN